MSGKSCAERKARGCADSFENIFIGQKMYRLCNDAHFAVRPLFRIARTGGDGEYKKAYKKAPHDSGAIL